MRIDPTPLPLALQDSTSGWFCDRLRRVARASEDLVAALTEDDHTRTEGLVADLLWADSATLVSAERRTPRHATLSEDVLHRPPGANGGSTMSVPLMSSHGVWRECRAYRSRPSAFGPVDYAIALAMETISLGAFRPPAAGETAHPLLSPRENAVADQLAAGRTRAAIARSLGVSVRTVDKHLEHIYTKLGRHDRLAAVRELADGGTRSYDQNVLLVRADGIRLTG